MLGRLWLRIRERLRESWLLLRRTDWRRVQWFRMQRLAWGERVVVAVTVAAVGVGVGAFMLNRTHNEFSSLPDNGSVRISPLQQTKIGSPFDKRATAFLGKHLQSTQQNGVTIYTYDSVRPGVKNEIQVEHGRVTFERMALPDSPAQEGFTNISFFLKLHGYPQRNIKGPATYGPSAVTYIYTDKGYAFVGQTAGDTIVEMQVFGKMSVDDYLKRYGQGLKG